MGEITEGVSKGCNEVDTRDTHWDSMDDRDKEQQTGTWWEQKREKENSLTVLDVLHYFPVSKPRTTGTMSSLRKY